MNVYIIEALQRGSTICSGDISAASIVFVDCAENKDQAVKKRTSASILTLASRRKRSRRKE